MTQMELRFCRWLDKHMVTLFFFIVTVLGGLIRLPGLSFVSGDASNFLLPWFDEIRNAGGLNALSRQVGNYNIPYQFLIALLTYLPYDKLATFKGLSILFDYILAVGAALCGCELLRKKTSELQNVFVTVYAAVLFAPTVILNSSVWAQCDSIYSAFAVFAILFLMKKNYKLSFAFLGIAISFKLQAVFILPFFVYFYFVERKCNLGHFLITALWFFIPSIPGYLYGRRFLDPLRIYLGQTTAHPNMWVNFPGFWVFAGDNYEVMGKIAILLTLFLLGSGLFYLLSKEKRLDTSDRLLKTAIWVVWTCVVFLPAMHERYGYLLEILLLILVAVDKKYLMIASIVEITSIVTYGHFLFGNSVDIVWLSIFYISAYLGFYWMQLKDADKI